MASQEPRWSHHSHHSRRSGSALTMDSLAAESDLRIISYVEVGCLALLTYDTLLNLDLEYRHIWSSKWGLIKCLYLWSRYGTFFDTSLAVLKRIDRDINLDPLKCNTLSKFITIFSGFGIGITEIILMTRTYALYGRSKKVLVFFMILWLSIGGFSIWAVINWMESVQVDPLPGISCDLYNSNDILLLCYIALLAGETVIVLLTLWKGFHTFYLVGSDAQYSHLITSFYRDGIMFYLVMLLTFIVVVVLQKRCTSSTPAHWRGTSSHHTLNFCLPLGYPCSGCCM
ncbi:hypothetical protein MVEN_01668900 [Mycena venus]|uniref:DUF6533 domain-containing protein n=1 Tax=Mycena venus TaxID=2733690 RepID=A0A8H7CR13_9AGAR|nr:hypothetical protein MVEN_01668900 [Mycena venus]